MNVLETALGALLHDIGKFAQRAFDSGAGLSAQSRNLAQMICPTGKHGHSTHLHVLHTNEFTENLEFLPAALDRSQIANLASYHHRPDTPQQQLIAKADRLSSGMERQAYEDDAPAGRHFFRRVRLQSVASTVAPPDAPEPQRACLPLAPLCPKDAFPLPTVSNNGLTEQYHRQLGRFPCRMERESLCRSPAIHQPRDVRPGAVHLVHSVGDERRPGHLVVRSFANHRRDRGLPASGRRVHR